jgi:hypothetical protein
MSNGTEREEAMTWDGLSGLRAVLKAYDANCASTLDVINEARDTCEAALRAASETKPAATPHPEALAKEFEAWFYEHGGRMSEAMFDRIFAALRSGGDAGDAERVVNRIKSFISEHRISCVETVYQTDRVQEHATELIEDLCELVGYYNEDAALARKPEGKA